MAKTQYTGIYKTHEYFTLLRKALASGTAKDVKRLQYSVDYLSGLGDASKPHIRELVALIQAVQNAIEAQLKA